MRPCLSYALFSKSVEEFRHRGLYLFTEDCELALRVRPRRRSLEKKSQRNVTNKQKMIILFKSQMSVVNSHRGNLWKNKRWLTKSRNWSPRTTPPAASLRDALWILEVTLPVWTAKGLGSVEISGDLGVEVLKFPLSFYNPQILIAK